MALTLTFPQTMILTRRWPARIKLESQLEALGQPLTHEPLGRTQSSEDKIAHVLNQVLEAVSKLQPSQAGTALQALDAGFSAQVSRPVDASPLQQQPQQPQLQSRQPPHRQPGSQPDQPQSVISDAQFATPLGDRPFRQNATSQGQVRLASYCMLLHLLDSPRRNRGRIRSQIPNQPNREWDLRMRASTWEQRSAPPPAGRNPLCGHPSLHEHGH